MKSLKPRILVLTDIKIFSNNSVDAPAGLLYEIISIIQNSPKIVSINVTSIPHFFARLYIPIKFAWVVMRSWLYWIKHIQSNPTVVILYPSRLRILAVFMPGRKICIGPDDTASVVQALAVGATIKYKLFRSIEKWINILLEKITPKISTLLVGLYDVEKYNMRNPNAPAIYLPHPLFTDDQISIQSISSLLSFSDDDCNHFTFSIIGGTLPNLRTFNTISLLSTSLNSILLLNYKFSLVIYGHKNKWLYDYLVSLYPGKCEFKLSFVDFAELISPYSAVIGLPPYRYGSKTRILNSLSNAIPCICNFEDIPDNIVSLPSLLSHIIVPGSILSEHRVKMFFDIKSRIAFSNVIRIANDQWLCQARSIILD